MSNIYDIFNERRSSLSMLSEGINFDYYSMDFDTVEEGLEELDNIQREMEDSTIRMCAESFVTDLLIESAMDEDFDENNIYQMITEAEEKEKENKTSKIKEMWGKIKAWFKKLFETIRNLFLNGEQLLKKYPDLEKRLASDKGKVKTMGFIDPTTAISKSLGMCNSLNAITKSGDFKKDAFSILKVESKKDLKKKIFKNFIQNDEKKETPIASLNFGIVIKYATEKKDLIDGIKKFESSIDADFKKALADIKNAKKEAQNKEEKARAVDDQQFLNFIVNLKTDICKNTISAIKKISGQCLSICRHACGMAADRAEKKANKSNDNDEKEAAEESFNAMLNALDNVEFIDDYGYGW